MNSREERVLDSSSDGDEAAKPANNVEDHRAVWEAGGLEAEPRGRGVCGAAVRGGAERRAECVLYEGLEGPAGAVFSQGGGEGDSTGAGGPVCLYGMGTGPQGPLCPPELLPSTEDSAASLGALDWRAEPVLIASKLCLPPPPPPAPADPFHGSGPSDGGYGGLQGGSAPPRGGGGREKRFFCSFCGKGFSFPKQVEIHQRVHTGEKPFSCTQCRQRFSHSGNLKRHQRVHTGEKPFSCTLCEKRFSHLHQLKMHQRIHTGERPFACAHCGKRFSERSYLRIHQQRSHSGVYSVR